MKKFGGLSLMLCGCVGLMMFASCSTSRHMEKKQSYAVYEALGLHKDSGDNLALYKEAASWLHVPHMDGGMSRSGVDCSFLVYNIYKTVYGRTIERNSLAMLKKNCEKINRDKLKEGDLAFFNTGGKSKAYVNHVGIYLKNNKFLHTSTSKGVIVSDLDEEYYRRTWVCGGRVR